MRPRSLLCVVAWLLIPALACQAEEFPARGITLIVPLAPGGSVDIVARIIGQKLRERLGKDVIIENRTGGSTVIAASAVARATPDGHTLLFSPTSTLAINPTVYKKLPYDPLKDFAPVALVAIVPLVLVVNPGLPVHSLPDLIKLAKEKPGQLSYASGGVGSTLHLAAEFLAELAGIAWRQVPYKGGAPALNDVVAGHVSAMFADIGGALPQIREGNVRALGVSTRARVQSAPEIAPIADWIPGYDATTWNMAIAPAATPEDILTKLHQEIGAVTGLPEVQERLAHLGISAAEAHSRTELRPFLEAQIDRWGGIVRRVGLAGSE